VKIFSAILISTIIVFVIGFSISDDKNDEHIDDWAKQTLALFKDTAGFFSSLRPETPDAVDNTIDDELNALLPSESVDLRYEPNLEETVNLANGESVDVSPDALLPNLFETKPKSGNATSVKGEIFTDEKDKVIGGKVQLAIPTDM